MFVFGAWIAIRLALGRTPPEQFGLRRVRNVGDARRLGGGGVYAGFWTVTIVLTLIFGQPDEQTLVTDLKAEDSLATLIACGAADLRPGRAGRGGALLPRLHVHVLARAARRGLGGAARRVVFGARPRDRAEPIPLIALGAFGVGLCLLYWRTQSIIPCMALHALNNSITFGVVKDLDPALFAGVVVAQRRRRDRRRPRAVRPAAGRRMRRVGLALARRARLLPATAAAQTPPPAPTPSRPRSGARDGDALGVRPGHARRSGRSPAARSPRGSCMQPVRRRTRRVTLRVYRGKQEDPGQVAHPQAGQRRHGGRGDAEGQVGEARPAARCGPRTAARRRSPTLRREDRRRRRRAALRRSRRDAARPCGCCRPGSRRCTTSCRARASMTPAPGAP